MNWRRPKRGVHSRCRPGNPEFTRGSIRASVRNGCATHSKGGDITACLHSFAPKAGDFVFLPAGTVHAVGGGVLFAEIQQTSDATFRLFDWNRVDAHGKPRPLHLDQAFASIHWDQGPIDPIPANGDTRQHLVMCPYFAIERCRWTASADDWEARGDCKP